ncbi:hypothetical protein Hanom_Chr17g01530471 [Helianthus anomalus]
MYLNLSIHKHFKHHLNHQQIKHTNSYSNPERDSNNTHQLGFNPTSFTIK